jgi:hypothetical protein
MWETKPICPGGTGWDGSRGTRGVAQTPILAPPASGLPRSRFCETNPIGGSRHAVAGSRWRETKPISGGAGDTPLFHCAIIRTFHPNLFVRNKPNFVRPKGRSSSLQHMVYERFRPKRAAKNKANFRRTCFPLGRRPFVRNKPNSLAGTWLGGQSPWGSSPAPRPSGLWSFACLLCETNPIPATPSGGTKALRERSYGESRLRSASEKQSQFSRQSRRDTGRETTGKCAKRTQLGRSGHGAGGLFERTKPIRWPGTGAFAPMLRGTARWRARQMGETYPIGAARARSGRAL